MKRLIVLLVMVSILTIVVSPASAWLDGYLYRKEITIDPTKVSGDLSSFPVLVTLTAADFDFGNARSDGYDIRFTSSDGTTLLNYERERYDSTSENAEHWVNLPSVSSSSDTKFYMYYGKSDASDGGVNATNVWDTNFKMVQHLQESPADDVKGHIDSTSYGNDATPKNFATGGTTDATGKIDGADEFEGTTNQVNCGTDSSLSIVDEVTLEAWVQSKAVGNKAIIGRGYYLPFCFHQHTNNKLTLRYKLTSGDNEYLASDLIIPIDEWCYVAVTHKYSTGEAHFYLNSGHEEMTATFTGTPWNSLTALVIGMRADIASDNTAFVGTIDEVRLSGVVRSGDWLEASYLNQSDPGTFYSMGGEQAVPEPSALLLLGSGLLGLLVFKRKTRG